MLLERSLLQHGMSAKPLAQVKLTCVYLYLYLYLYLVMVDGPAVGKAGDCLDWIAGGLEIKGLRDSGNPCPL